MKNDIFPLFAYPVMICGQRYQFSESETEFISELETIDNIGNSMSKNDRVLDDNRLCDLKAFIEEQIFVFKKNLFRIKDDNPIYITQSWVNFAKPGQFHPKHKHPNSVISGVMFLGILALNAAFSGRLSMKPGRTLFMRIPSPA